MNILGIHEKQEISRHHKPCLQVISYPEYYSTATGILSWIGISNNFGGCKEEVGWKKLNMVHAHR